MIIRLIKFADNMIDLLLMHYFSPELNLILSKSLFNLREAKSSINELNINK